jgi:hypothetical protein
MKPNEGITNLGRAEMKFLMSRVHDLLAGELEELGLAIQVTGGRYGGATGSVRVELVAKKPGAADWEGTKEWADLLGRLHLQPDLLGAHKPGDRVRVPAGPGTEDFRLIGWRSRARVRPVLARRLSDGKDFCLTVYQLSMAKSLEEQS